MQQMLPHPRRCVLHGECLSKFMAPVMLIERYVLLLNVCRANARMAGRTARMYNEQPTPHDDVDNVSFGERPSTSPGVPPVQSVERPQLTPGSASATPTGGSSHLRYLVQHGPGTPSEVGTGDGMTMMMLDRHRGPLGHSRFGLMDDTPFGFVSGGGGDDNEWPPLSQSSARHRHRSAAATIGDEEVFLGRGDEWGLMLSKQNALHFAEHSVCSSMMMSEDAEDYDEASCRSDVTARADPLS